MIAKGQDYFTTDSKFLSKISEDIVWKFKYFQTFLRHFHVFQVIMVAIIFYPDMMPGCLCQWEPRAPSRGSASLPALSLCVRVCACACSFRSPARAKPALRRIVTFSVHSCYEGTTALLCTQRIVMCWIVSVLKSTWPMGK